METIRDATGSVIQRSRNLRGIRSYVGANIIKVLAIEPIAHGEGKLMILFDNGANYETNFACYSVLRQFVRQWRNVYGAPLLVNHVPSGTVDAKNIALSD